VDARTGVFRALTKEQREQLMALAHEASFAMGERIFDEGGRADRFWIIHTGTVALDLHVPGQRAVVIETLGAGELLGWSCWPRPPLTRAWCAAARRLGAPVIPGAPCPPHSGRPDAEAG
jgi:signal-transduction protein with cAMP-binding, CBS, and nucleotidyltransferase domain